ncbi:uncharacterized protein AMSG_05374 [Thecamonas trahens ATCC 50062]|uniref:DH domain-containing protein n=1 Tax=Thecamonas trahens ATCC 50062 TaxID=461836 RepID=A0A0L0DAW1_THETB|nr:hypothetical protein AMSG_05374 [Thecamonas trahens ATCC 50062]KNC49375.1 hypothetical protein AMSG_05374 [Thecamonas trahens ATCC 50062]|eukprot:XP_013757800.1 hypothetical protein AMSG_05374 [Thecamonas trahens ATCC 50062]
MSSISLTPEELAVYPAVFQELSGGSDEGTISGTAVLQFSRGTHLPRKTLRPSAAAVLAACEAAAPAPLSDKDRSRLLKLVKASPDEPIDSASAVVMQYLAHQLLHTGFALPKKLPDTLWPRMRSAMSDSQPLDPSAGDTTSAPAPAPTPTSTAMPAAKPLPKPLPQLNPAPAATTPEPAPAPAPTPAPVPATATAPQIVDFDASQFEVVPKNAMFVINEIVDTEVGYVQDLHYIVNEYILPLRAAKFVENSTVNEIFMTIEPLLETNTMLMNDLLAARKDAPQDQLVAAIAGALINVSQYLKMYSDYCNNQVNALNLLDKAKKKSAMAAFCDTRAAAAGGLGAGDFLIKPIQRICKYPLLLRALLKELGPLAPGRAEVERAFELICAIADDINEKKRDNEAKRGVVLAANSMISAPKGLVNPTRRLVDQGPFVLNGEKERYYFLFNDLLVLTKPNKERYKYKLSLILRDLVINDDATELPTFQLADVRHGSNYVITLPTAGAKKAFVSALRTAMETFKAHIEDLNNRRRSTSVSLPPPAVDDPQYRTAAAAAALASGGSSTGGSPNPAARLGDGDLALEFDDTATVSASIRAATMSASSRAPSAAAATVGAAAAAAPAVGRINAARPVADSYCVIVLGEERAGKTALLKRAAGSPFESRYTTTPDPREQFNVVASLDGVQKHMRLHEANTNTLPALTAASPAIHGIFLVFSIVSSSSFAVVSDMMDHLRRMGAPTRGLPIILVGTHADKAARRVVRSEDAVALGDRLGAVFLEASSLTASNVNFVFELMARKIAAKAGPALANAASSASPLASSSPSISIAAPGAGASIAAHRAAGGSSAPRRHSSYGGHSMASAATAAGRTPAHHPMNRTSSNPLLGHNPLLGPTPAQHSAHTSPPTASPPAFAPAPASNPAHAPPSYSPVADPAHRPRSMSSVGASYTAPVINDFNVNPRLLSQQQLIDLVLRLQANITACPASHTPAK